VGLSRCKSLEALVLSSPIADFSVKNDHTVLQFTDEVEQNQPGQTDLEQARKDYIRQLLNELFDFRPIERQIQYLLKLWEEHQDQLLGSMKNTLQGMTIPLQTELINVADKFDNQLRQLIVASSHAEDDVQLQDRIKKASDFFAAKLFIVVEEPFSLATFETDNKAIRKSFNEAADKLHKEIQIKKACLNLCKNGFSIKTYLETKSKANIEVPETGYKPKTSGSGANALTMHPEFYSKLKRWRDNKAQELNVELRRVLPQKTMLEIVQTLPSTKRELLAVKGMGGKRVKQFGRDLLEMLIEYRREKGMALPEEVEKEKKEASLSSKEISFELFKEGKSIVEIAGERGMAVSTIEGHLASFVGTGDIRIEQLVKSNKVKEIQQFNEKKELLDIN